MKKGTLEIKISLSEMLRGGVIMDVTTSKQAQIAEDSGAIAVMALERIPADIKGNEKIKNYLIHNFPDYQVENIVVSLFKPQGHGNIDVWRRAGAEIIFGEEFLKKYFNLNFIDFRKKLNKNVEANNKIILGLINRVKKDTENKIKNNDFTVDEDINPLFN